MNLVAIVALTLVAGTGSVWVSHLLTRSSRLLRRWPDRGTDPWQGAAAGALLATAFLYLLPEAVEAADSRRIFTVVLAGMAAFFVLDRAELWHHGHEHTRASGGAWSVLAGDALHAFGDGVLVAAAFVSDARSGLITALAVTAHEVPHHAGDLAVVGARTNSPAGAFAKVSVAGSFCVVGGAAGWWLAGALAGMVPYLLALACSSFIYVALSDLVPQLQRPGDAREGCTQLASLLAGGVAAALAGQIVQGH